MLVRPRAGEAVELDQAALEAELADIVRNWHDDLRDALVAAQGEREGLALASRYGRALSTPYLQEAGTDVAVDDVRHLAMLHGLDDLALSLHGYRLEEHTAVLQSLRRIESAVFSQKQNE